MFDKPDTHILWVSAWYYQAYQVLFKSYFRFDKNGISNRSGTLAGGPANCYPVSKKDNKN